VLEVEGCQLLLISSYMPTGLDHPFRSEQVLLAHSLWLVRWNEAGGFISMGEFE
jgi:hypothetical protein